MVFLPFASCLSKKVFLLPARGKEQLLLDMVLEWAERAECLDEYEAKGCVFNKAKATYDNKYTNMYEIIYFQ